MTAQPSAWVLNFLSSANSSVADAQSDALAAGVPIIYKDASGRYVQQHSDGRIFEVRFRPEYSGDDHLEVIRELPRRVF